MDNESPMQQYTFPAGYNFLTSIPRMFKQVQDAIGTMEDSMRRFNGTYTVHLGTRKYIITQDPGFIDHVLRVNHRNYYKSPLQTERLGKFLGNGLLTANGDYWLKQRRLIQPGFHADKIQALYEIIGKTVNKFLDELPLGKQDIYPLMNILAFRIVINTLFDIHIPDDVRKELSSFISETQAFVIKEIRQPYKKWWFNISGEEKRNKELAQRARNIIDKIISERKKSSQKFNDLLDMLLDARYEDTGLPMTNDQIIDEILVLIIAGHETTANALSWTLYLLAHHPDEIKKLRETTPGLTLKEIVKNDSIQGVLKESMRLYPPAYATDRVALHDDSYQQYKFPKDTIVILFFYGLHRDPAHWLNPSAFNPERFIKGDKEFGKVYLPFGGGPRLCIGNNFAMAEMAIFLHAFIHRFSVQPTSIQPRLNPLVTLKPDHVVLNVLNKTDNVSEH